MAGGAKVNQNTFVCIFELLNQIIRLCYQTKYIKYVNVRKKTFNWRPKYNIFLIRSQPCSYSHGTVITLMQELQTPSCHHYPTAVCLSDHNDVTWTLYDCKSQIPRLIVQQYIKTNNNENIKALQYLCVVKESQTKSASNAESILLVPSCRKPDDFDEWLNQLKQNKVGQQQTVADDVVKVPKSLVSFFYSQFHWCNIYRPNPFLYNQCNCTEKNQSASIALH